MVDARFPASEQDAPCMSPPGRMSELRDRAQRLRFELPEIAAKADAENTDSRDSMRRIWEEGLFDIHLPVRYDGVADAEPSRFAEDYFAILLDLVSGDSSAGMAFAVHSMVTMEIFDKASRHAESRGLILADTKFEFGVIDGQIALADEVLTPDSSRYWPAERYTTGGPQPSFDKQYVRDYLESIHWNKQAPAPELPEDVVLRTREKYLEAFRLISGRTEL